MIAAALLVATLSSSDAAFVRSASDFDNGELSRARAAINSTNVPQERYAQRVTSDVTQLSEELVVLARQYRVLLYDLPGPEPGAPSTPGPAHAGTIAARPYLQIEIRDQRAFLGTLAREARGAGTPALRDFARRMTGVIRANLALAQRYLNEEQHHARL
jgi:hypothetical protein